MSLTHTDRLEDDLEPDAGHDIGLDAEPEEHADVLVTGPPVAEREERLADGADALGARRSVLAGTNVLLMASGALLTAGLTVILLGWWGAANSTIVEEQVPYLISGGLLGVALAVVGGLVFFAQWLTLLIRENREREAVRARDHRELVDELRSLRAALAARAEPVDPELVSPRPGRAGRAPRRASAGGG